MADKFQRSQPIKLSKISVKKTKREPDKAKQEVGQDILEVEKEVEEEKEEDFDCNAMLDYENEANCIRRILEKERDGEDTSEVWQLTSKSSSSSGLPSRMGSSKVVRQTKAGILQKILPLSLIPSATSSGFLVFGSRPSQCFFHLREYLVVTGAISLGIPVMGAIFRFLVDRMLKDKQIDKEEEHLLKCMQHFGSVVVFLEAGFLIAGSAVILPNVTRWQYLDKSDTSTYCDFGLMTFSLAFLSASWIFVTVGTFLYMFIMYLDPYRNPVTKKPT